MLGGLRGMAARLIAATKEEQPTYPPGNPAEIEPFQVYGHNPFALDEKARSKRQEAALSMADEDTFGYVLILLKRDEDGNGQMSVATHMDRAWWPAFRTTLERIRDAIV